MHIVFKRLSAETLLWLVSRVTARLVGLVLHAVTKSRARDEGEEIYRDKQKLKIINDTNVEFPHSTWTWESETETKQSGKF